MAVVDYNTCAGGDKFGNFFVNRIPSEVTEEVEEDPTGNRLVFERGSLNGCLHKVRLSLSRGFFVQEGTMR